MNESIEQVNVRYESCDNRDIRVVTIHGKITSLNSYDINKKIQKYFNNDNFDTILDISKLEYLDSKGMAMLITIQKTIKEQNGTLLLTTPTTFVKELFELTNLDTFFTFTTNVESGVDYFGVAK